MIQKKRNLIGGLVGSLLLASVPLAAQADGTVNVMCSDSPDWCSAIKNGFEKKTGIKVQLTLKSTGEALALLAAEKENPKQDVWIGGTGDPHLQAAELNLTESYRSPSLMNLHDWAKRQAEQSNYRTVGIYAGVLAFGYNPELLAKKRLPAPACWSDLLKPAYKDEIQIANPNSSGTAYVVIASLVQLMGEDKAFEYLKSLHKNVNQYPRSGIAPVKAVGRGETSVGIGWYHDGATEAMRGFPVKVTTPCEGAGYEIGSMSIVKGAKNIWNAKKWYEYALSVEGQAVAADVFEWPANTDAPLAPQAPKFVKIKLIDYNFAKYGSSEERKRLLARWDREIGSLSK